MIVRFESCKLKLEEILKEDDPKKFFTENELSVINLVRKWNSEDQIFYFKTSGSTGTLKEIGISREKIRHSAQATLNFLDPDHTFKSTLLCLNANFIGGAMVVLRALIHGMNLVVTEPSASLGQWLNGQEYYDLASMIPMQIQKLTSQQLDMFKVVIVGGGHLSRLETASSAEIYFSFGMTETVSHFALRKNGTAYYQTIADTEIAADDEKKLMVRGFLTDHKWLKTNDLIDIISSNKFNWIGRADFIINSGGIKVNPIIIEEELKRVIGDNSFIVSSVPDKVLENKIVLLIEGSPKDINYDFSMLERYHRPKQVIFMDSFVRTVTGKTDRIKTREKIVF